MDRTGALILLIAIGIAIIFLIIKVLKPYVLKYDSTILFTGGLGSGKTLNSVKQVDILYRKTYWQVYVLGNLKIKIKNLFRKKENKLEKIKKPFIYSNIPLSYKEHIWSTKRKMTKKLELEHIMLTKQMREYSIVFIDELPQLVNQFNWDNDLVQKNINEFITFFRHYVGGYLVTNGQSESDIVVQIRRKLNQCIWCRNFQPHFFKLFYTTEMTTLSMSDNVANINQTQLDEKTQRRFGILLGMNKKYNTRCYKPRYENIYMKEKDHWSLPWEPNKLTTTRVLRVEQYTSPLDDTTTTAQKIAIQRKIDELKNTKKETKNENGKNKA